MTRAERAPLDPPSWERLQAVLEVLQPPTSTRSSLKPATAGTAELPSWESLSHLAKLLNVRRHRSDARLCPADPARIYVIRSLNQTANKPLHVGHLRNSALGAAAAGCATMLGARVLRQCVIEDTGRYMTEAMAAIADLERSGAEATVAAGMKGDQFIGMCYRRYRRAIARGRSAKATTLYEARNDDADALQRALMQGDDAARRLWRIVATMTLDGQQATLRELGVDFDCCDYESAEDAFVEGFIERGLREGVLVRTRGEVVYRPTLGRELRLLNSAGLPEESARLLSLIWRLFATWPQNATHIVVAGTEWRTSMEVYRELMTRLGLQRLSDLYAQAFYGMVVRDGKKMSSSDGSGVLVDTLLSDLAASEPIARLTGAVRDGLAVQLAATALKCYLLTHARTAQIEFDPDALSAHEHNPGLAIAAAWVALAARERARPGSLSTASRPIVEEALSRVSFEAAVHRTATLAGAVARGEAAAGERADFRAMVEALAVVPRRSSLTFADRPPLATMAEPKWRAA